MGKQYGWWINGVMVPMLGAMDMVTGLLLMWLPVRCFEWMAFIVGAHSAWIDDRPELTLAAPYIGLGGAFVFATGSLYSAAWWYWNRGHARQYQLLLGLTAWIRFVVFLYTLSGVLSGALGRYWILVPVTDGALAIGQAVWLKIGGAGNAR